MARSLRFGLLVLLAVFALAGCGGGSAVPVADGGVDGPRHGGPHAADGGTGTDAKVGAEGGAFARSIGGSVTGLTGTGLVLQDNHGDNLTVTANGTFTFDTKLAPGSSYSVTVLNEPTDPSETCVVSKGSGTVNASNVTNVAVVCTLKAFTIGGTVTGLSAADGGAGLVLEDNGGGALAVSGNGAFTFSAPVPSGHTFNVTVKSQPSSPVQACTVSGGQGTVGASAVNTVVVNCAADTFTIGVRQRVSRGA